MQAAGVSWLGLPGPLADLDDVECRVGTFISGPRLDAFTIPQLALLHLDSLPPRYLAVFAFWRHANLGERKPFGAPFDLLWKLHQEWRARRQAEPRSRRIQLSSASIFAPLSGFPCGVQQKPGETQYAAITRAIGEAEPPKPTEDQRRAAFVSAVMRPAL
jgi:hypothetical protein